MVSPLSSMHATLRYHYIMVVKADDVESAGRCFFGKTRADFEMDQFVSAKKGF